MQNRYKIQQVTFYQEFFRDSQQFSLQISGITGVNVSEFPSKTKFFEISPFARAPSIILLNFEAYGRVNSTESENKDSTIP